MYILFAKQYMVKMKTRLCSKYKKQHRQKAWAVSPVGEMAPPPQTNINNQQRNKHGKRCLLRQHSHPHKGTTHSFACLFECCD